MYYKYSKVAGYVGAKKGFLLIMLQNQRKVRTVKECWIGRLNCHNLFSSFRLQHIFYVTFVDPTFERYGSEWVKRSAEVTSRAGLWPLRSRVAVQGSIRRTSSYYNYMQVNVFCVTAFLLRVTAHGTVLFRLVGIC